MKIDDPAANVMAVASDDNGQDDSGSAGEIFQHIFSCFLSYLRARGGWFLTPKRGKRSGIFGKP